MTTDHRSSAAVRGTAPAFDLVLFGGTGDLAMRKLLPALYRRYADGLIPPDARILGVAAATRQPHVDVHEHLADALGVGHVAPREAPGEAVPGEVSRERKPVAHR